MLDAGGEPGVDFGNSCAARDLTGGRLAVNTEVRVDDAGKIHLTGVKAVEEPSSLADLRSRTTAMLPRVDLPEVILEVMAWVPELTTAFTAVSGGRSRPGRLFHRSPSMKHIRRHPRRPA
jgi:hypothetical protein